MLSHPSNPRRRARSDSRQVLVRFHRSHRGTPTLGCPICTFSGRQAR